MMNATVANMYVSVVHCQVFNQSWTLTLSSLGAKFVKDEELSQQLWIKIIYWF